MIKQDVPDPVPWDPPTLVYGKVASVPLQAAASNPFVLMPSTSSADSVMADDGYRSLAGFGAAALLLIFVVLLVIPSFFGKGD